MKKLLLMLCLSYMGICLGANEEPHGSGGGAHGGAPHASPQGRATPRSNVQRAAPQAVQRGATPQAVQQAVQNPAAQGRGAHNANSQRSHDHRGYNNNGIIVNQGYDVLPDEDDDAYYSAPTVPVINNATVNSFYDQNGDLIYDYVDANGKTVYYYLDVNGNKVYVNYDEIDNSIDVEE